MWTGYNLFRRRAFDDFAAMAPHCKKNSAPRPDRLVGQAEGQDWWHDRVGPRGWSGPRADARGSIDQTRGYRFRRLLKGCEEIDSR